ncbi:hypothetical protein NM688_g41 [Phlebia brevispora]|uniref:Uncharacterized protein n=1 Tax=Phlebia brevispora TaxID=194682 RepID=A0ACC1TFH2_9APHY|nr:hypothetical protein NM688_g41 [Phlebia brevispora]
MQCTEIALAKLTRRSDCPSMSSPLQILNPAVGDIYTLRYTIISPLVMLLYNYLLTLPNEIELFWVHYSRLNQLQMFTIDVAAQNRRWSLAQLLFLLIRYPPIVWEICLAFVFFNSRVPSPVRDYLIRSMIKLTFLCTPRSLMVVSTCHAILILRLCGVYDRVKILLYFLLSFFSLTIGINLYIIASFLPVFEVVNLSSSVGNFCSPERDPKGLLLLWIPLVAFETALYLLVLYKVIEHSRNGTPSASRIMQVIIRDSIAYFFIIMTVDIANFITWTRATPILRGGAVLFMQSVSSILGSQMLVYDGPPVHLILTVKQVVPYRNREVNLKFYGRYWYLWAP